MIQIAIFTLILGLAFVIIEMFIPGFGVFGILGILLTALSMFLTVIYVPMGWAIIMIELIVIAMGFYLLFRMLRSRQGKNGLILYDKLAPNKKNMLDISSLIGKEAVTTTSLRPVGEIELNNHTFEVTAAGEYILPQTTVVITKIVGSMIYVSSVSEMKKTTNEN